MARFNTPTTLSLMAATTLVPTLVAAEMLSRFLPSGLLTEDAVQTLPVEPTKVVALDEAAYVIGTGEDGLQILRLDGVGLEVTATRSLDMARGNAILSSDMQLLYVVGARDGGPTRMLILDRDLEQVGEWRSEVPVAYPALSLAKGNRLMIGGLPAGAAEGALLAVDMSEPTAPVPIPELMLTNYNLFGIAGVWLEDTGEPTLFINTALLPALVAIELGPKGATELADLSFDDGRYEQKPLTVFGNIGSRPCPTEPEMATFLVSSNANQDLYLTVFDRDFKSLDVVSRTDTSLRQNAADGVEYYPESKALAPTRLLSSACDMGVVWIGDRNAGEIEQFAVNPDLMTLEKVGEIALPQNPAGLAISASGRTAYVISSGNRTITRYASGGNVVSGTEDARALQRLLTDQGYPVGVIDGQIGSRTQSAISRFERRTGVDLGVEGNLKGALDILQNMPLK